MTQEALKLALEALERLALPKNADDIFRRAITAIKETLAQEQEPMATVEDNSQKWKNMDGAIAFHLIERHADNWSDARKMMEEWLSANTAPPQRTWVGLTSEKIDSYFENHGWSPSEDYYPVIKDIEAKLKKLNT